MDQSNLTKWDNRWLDLAAHVATWSKDPSTKVGAVIADGKKLLSVGYNGFPATCPDYDHLYEDRETKYKLVTHAEVNAILNSGFPVNGATVYTTPLAVCSSCAGIIAASGIKRVVSRLDPTKSKTPKFLSTYDTETIFKWNGIDFEIH